MATLSFLRFTSSAYIECTTRAGLRSLSPSTRSRACVRSLSTTGPLHSGHSRWSKIKHDKGKADAKIARERTLLAQALQAASKEGGADPQLNPKLALLLKQAASMGFPKASVAAALARGQGLSPSGTVLAPYTIELMHGPTGAAAIVDCLTDNKAKTLQNVREAMRSHDATGTATEWMFERRGRIVFGGATGGALGGTPSGAAPGAADGDTARNASAWTDEKEMQYVDAATAAGALDVDFPLSDPDCAPEELEDAQAVVYTEPQQMAAVASAMSRALGGAKPERSELVWVPKPESAVPVGEAGDADGSWASLSRMVERIESESTVQSVWLNVR